VKACQLLPMAEQEYQPLTTITLPREGPRHGHTKERENPNANADQAC
jgi:hypothetical protein